MGTGGSIDERILAQRILETLHLVMRRIWAEVKGNHEGVFPAQSYRLLGMLARRPYTLTELARAQAVRPSTVSRAVRALSDLGWVEMERDPADRRRVWIRLTPAGRRVLRRLQLRAAARLGRRLARLSPEQRLLLAQAMDLLQQAIGGDSPH
ncbi:MarR family winged helix-turn-helix transcriptional regulator [Thermoflexus sp.]|uniref:MarR family winged helix-turn-helix transcriptional regulator n=1 Tax=Thermoflexus sp. TaxID=1969742 RepID=UPI0035E41803